MLTFIITQPPYASDNARNALDMIMIAVSFDQPTQVIFMHDGVWQLTETQSKVIGQKSVLPKYAVLTDIFEFSDIYVCQQSAESRGLDLSQLQLDAQSLAPEGIQKKLAVATKTVRF